MIGWLSPPRSARLSLITGVVGVLAFTSLIFSPIAGAEPIRGAGSTFAAPIINKWSHDYEAFRTDGGDYTSPDWQVDYEPVGSLAGVMRLNQPDVDFAATDAPLLPEELNQRGWAQFPIVMGGITVVANLDGVGAGQLRLSAPVLADIYLGKITNWSDPAIKALNPGLSLPDATIEVLHRQDGSGSTLTFTTFLSSTSPEWKDKYGANTLIPWPRGRGERGTGGLAALAAATKNSIAYLEYGQVIRAGMPFVSLENSSGTFVRPGPESFRAGLAKAGWKPSAEASADRVKPAEANAYPMVVVTYAVLPKDRGPQRINRVLDLFRLAFKQGGDEAVALGYIPVSTELADQIDAYWVKNLSSVNN
ncbi:Phosphate-binding protein PstS [Hyphomicrobiales bacterium]|nr:Phosphate-binding protein PstS [Hyphomicrobiales bacterium]CAH1689987.1 Phosphate-binding protein PstS [Hyphomicrobiales bacterium]